jgi:hypothetical protein
MNKERKELNTLSISLFFSNLTTTFTLYFLSNNRLVTLAKKLINFIFLNNKKDNEKGITEVLC